MKNKNIVIVDYGHVNLFSVYQACVHVGYNPLISSDPQIISKADNLILPGVGAYKVAMNQLIKMQLVDPILEFVKKGNFMMGICLGMQLLFDESDEFGNCQGLSLIQGVVKKIPSVSENQKLKIPQIGWNTVAKNIDKQNWETTPLKGLSERDFFYFVHSYYVLPKNQDDVLGITNYGGFNYCSAVKKENVIGFQFHPEKSGPQGLSIYSKFLKL
jgi:glutamine amidotransferase